MTNEGNVTVALDITLTDDLRNEGIARDIVNRIQNIRKNRGYEITDKIILTFDINVPCRAAVEAYGEYIARQVLAAEIAFAENIGETDEGVEVLDLDGMNIPVKITLNKQQPV